MQWKLCLAIIGSSNELLDIVRPIAGEPFENEYLMTDEGRLNMFTWLRASSQEVEYLDDRLTATLKDDENFTEFDIAAFHCDGTWKKLELH